MKLLAVPGNVQIEDGGEMIVELLGHFRRNAFMRCVDAAASRLILLVMQTPCSPAMRVRRRPDRVRWTAREMYVRVASLCCSAMCTEFGLRSAKDEDVD